MSVNNKTFAFIFINSFTLINIFNHTVACSSEITFTTAHKMLLHVAISINISQPNETTEACLCWCARHDRATISPHLLNSVPVGCLLCVSPNWRFTL